MKTRATLLLAHKKSVPVKALMVAHWNAGKILLAPGLGSRPKADKNLFPATSTSFACE